MDRKEVGQNVYVTNEIKKTPKQGIERAIDWHSQSNTSSKRGTERTVNQFIDIQIDQKKETRVKRGNMAKSNLRKMESPIFDISKDLFIGKRNSVKKEEKSESKQTTNTIQLNQD
jgi:hypothetical protein